MNPNRFTITARWVFPVESPPMQFGKIIVENGTIVAVERDATPGDFHFPDHFVIPGLVNAHTHLDLSGLRGKCPPSADFTGWLKQVIGHRREQTPEMIQRDIQSGIDELVASGTTLVGDINVGGTSVELLSRSPMHSLVYFEVLGLTEAGVVRSKEGMANWLQAPPPDSLVARCLSPHAPYSVGRSLFQAVAEATNVSGCHLATHLAESEAEVELLSHRRGPFRSFLESLGVWNEAELVTGFEEVISLLWQSVPKLFVHANYLDPEVALPPNSTIVYCPRTHAAFGHAPHPFREFLKRGVRVVLGTDSLASNPDLDILREAAFFNDLHPDIPGDLLLRMITASSADALDSFALDGVRGTLAPRSSADLVVIPIGTSNGIGAEEMIWDAGRRNLPRCSMFRGVPVGNISHWTEFCRTSSLRDGFGDQPS
jgi:aminodeoxyfutalosine deaminase